MGKDKCRSGKIFLFSIFCILFSAFCFMSLTGCGKAQSLAGKDVYYCPMHPTYTSDRPGDCPICNMKLVKKEEAHVKAAGTTSPEAAEEKTPEEVCIEHNCTMKDCRMLVKAGLKPGERVICPICGEVITTTSGKVVEIAGHPAGSAGQITGPTVMISPEKQQLIGVKTEAVKKRDIGKIIRASGKIAYDPELAITQEEFVQALTNEENIKDSPLQDVVDRARSTTEASRRKLKLLGMTDEQISEIERTKKVQTNLYLPKEGENVWAYIAIYEYEIGLVRQGASVEIEAISYPGELFSGKVMSINPVLDPATRTNQVRVEVENRNGKLKPEMFVNARIHAHLGEKLALPKSAVLDTGIRKIVYLSKPGDMLESREVLLGREAEGYYEVISGLAEGDMVVTSGNFLVDSETKLKAASADSPAHQHGQ